jgi:hypothetical protein
MQNISQVQDLLVAYTPTYTSTLEQAYPLESLKEPVSGGDAYYEDFSEGLRRFALARGGAEATALVIAGGADLVPDDSDDELDADEGAHGGAYKSSEPESSILAFAVGSGAGSITGAIVDRAVEARPENFHADVKSLLAYAKQVGSMDDEQESSDEEFVVVDGEGAFGAMDETEREHPLHGSDETILSAIVETDRKTSAQTDGIPD